MADFLRGANEMGARVRRYRDGAREGVQFGVLTALANVLNVSNSRVPHETGALERDGAAGIVETPEGSVKGAVTYGRTGDTPKYAERQHEDMSLHHDGGRSAKFLEHAFAQTKDQNLAIIQKAVKKATGAA